MPIQDDRELIASWLDFYNAQLGPAFALSGWPDADERSRPAIDAVAVDSRGTKLGIEHSLFQPFVGERFDADRFMRTLGRLEGRSDLVEADSHVYASIPVGGIPTGADWEAIGSALEGWFRSNLGCVPAEPTERIISGRSFNLVLRTRKCHVPGSGRLFALRQMPAEDYELVVRTGLKAKLGKLLAAQVDVRVLLVEQNHPARGFWEVGECVEALRPEFPELAGVDEIWCANTVGREREQFVSFHQVWRRSERLDAGDSAARSNLALHPTAVALPVNGRG